MPVRTNPDLRPSRLIRSIPRYVLRSAATIVRSFAIYRPLRFFAGIGLALFGLGALLALRYLYYVLVSEGAGHVQSVMVSCLLMGLGIFTGLIGVIADPISVNRRLLEQIDARLRAIELAAPAAPRRRSRREAA